MRVADALGAVVAPAVHVAAAAAQCRAPRLRAPVGGEAAAALIEAAEAQQSARLDARAPLVAHDVDDATFRAVAVGPCTGALDHFHPVHALGADPVPVDVAVLEVASLASIHQHLEIGGLAVRGESARIHHARLAGCA